MRNEGIAAHWLIEHVHKGFFHADELVDRKADNGVFITAEMIEHVSDFLNAIMGKGQVECDTSYGSDQRYQVNGRADHIYYHPDSYTLAVSDFKYGWGIIEPQDNWTLISHAIGWMFANPNISVQQVALYVYQPRPHHSLGKVRHVIYPTAEIWQKWNVLEQALTNPTNTLRTSEHCRKCPAVATCPAALQAGMNAIDVSETAYVADIDNNALGYMLDNIDRALKVLEENKKAYSELALHRLKAGQIINGYGTEKDLTNKQWKEGINADTVLLLTGKDLSKKKELVTPNQAVKAGLDQTIVDSLCERREKGVKLVRMDANTAVKKLFKEVIQ